MKHEYYVAIFNFESCFEYYVIQSMLQFRFMVRHHILCFFCYSLGLVWIFLLKYNNVLSSQMNFTLNFILGVFRKNDRVFLCAFLCFRICQSVKISEDEDFSIYLLISNNLAQWLSWMSLRAIWNLHSGRSKVMVILAGQCHTGFTSCPWFNLKFLL